MYMRYYLDCHAYYILDKLNIDKKNAITFTCIVKN